MNYCDVLSFWFEELDKEQWFTQSDELDALIRKRFMDLHREIVEGRHEDWKETPEGTLAYVIVLDQFSRNMFRGTPEAYAYDRESLGAAKEAVVKGFDKMLPEDRRAFLYMPYMHSESKEIHEEALALFEALGNEENLKYERLHKRIIDRFGRYPHRNAVLGRQSTPEEQQFLEEDEHAAF